MMASDFAAISLAFDFAMPFRHAAADAAAATPPAFACYFRCWPALAYFHCRFSFIISFCYFSLSTLSPFAAMPLMPLLPLPLAPFRYFSPIITPPLIAAAFTMPLFHFRLSPFSFFCH
jgi:hypothetical protein